MTLITNNSNNLTKIKPSKMPSTTMNYQFMLGIAAFSTSFGLSLVPTWDFSKAFFTAIITVLATYSSAFFVDKRRRNNELRVIGSLHRRIRDLEGLKYRIIREVKQLEEYQNLLYNETQQLENKINECRSQRDSIHRDIGTYAAQKKQIEQEINTLKNEFQNLENSNSELNNSCNNLIAEKRRLEIAYNVSRSEFNQLQTQIDTFKQEKQQLESDVTLLERIKPQLEEKLYEFRIEIQKQEIEIDHQKKLIIDTNKTQKNLENSINNLQNQAISKQAEVNQLQNQISLLQTERDLMQNQVWELLQQLETVDYPTSEDVEQIEQDDIGLFPFDELIEPLEKTHKSNRLTTEWQNLLENLPAYQIEVLTAILEQENPQHTIKQIAEKHITMPNLLIDAINETANNTIGELIIETNTETPKIASEHLLSVQKMITINK